MSNPDPTKWRLERTHSASFCTKNHQNLFINKIVPQITILYLGITSLTGEGRMNKMRVWRTILYHPTHPKNQKTKSIKYGAPVTALARQTWLVRDAEQKLVRVPHVSSANLPTYLGPTTLLLLAFWAFGIHFLFPSFANISKMRETRKNII